MPTLPLLSIMKAVEVAVPADVDVEMAKSGVVAPAAPAIESFAHGVVVPIPMLLAVEIRRVDVAVKVVPT